MATREETKKMIEVIKQAEEALVHMCQTTSAKDNYRGSIVQLALVALREEIQKSDPYAHLKAAAQDPTKQISCTGSMWRDAGYHWEWNYLPDDYEIRDKPKTTKKVKLLAWLSPSNGELFWRDDSYSFTGDAYFKRVPSEDKEIEVEE